MADRLSTLEKANYPRPDFIRRDWMSLDGKWEFAFPDQITGAFPQEYKDSSLPSDILVPFCYSAAASGIGCAPSYEEVYYARSFSINSRQLTGEVLLKFGAVDYLCRIWINETYIGSHCGGHTQFEFPISSYLHPGENRIYVLASDNRDCDRPRGKQYWKEHPDRCWYTNTVGIWKSVWLEFTSPQYIQRVKITPDIDRRCIELEAFLNENCDGVLRADISFGNELRRSVSFSFKNAHYIREFISIAEEDFVDEIHYWDCSSPNLYDLTLSLSNGDQADCYFGMRKIETRHGQVFLNNRPLYQRLILDQGYWKDSLMTPPSSEALKLDIKRTKEMGFNGARKHQKLEDPRYYYWADVLGLLVWCEMPSAYQFNDAEIASILSEWQEILGEAYNHPSIITWVPFNESWGIRNVLSDNSQQNFAAAVYALTKAYDPTRLVSTNDGWENPAQTDLSCIHDYESSPSVLSHRYKDMEAFFKTGLPGRQALTQNASYLGQPFLLTEYGGIALEADSIGENWGYNESALSEQDYESRICGLTEAVLELPNCCGYCYTQLTDVMQEVNGLLCADRTPKLPLESLYQIFSKNPEIN